MADGLTRQQRRAAAREMERRGGRPIGERELVEVAAARMGDAAGTGVRMKVDLRGINSESQVYVQDMDDLLVKMARMQRDGWSIDRIRQEVQVPRHSLVPGGFVESDAVFQRAIDQGHALLAERIAAGTEPEESVVEVIVDPLELADDDDAELDLEQVVGNYVRPVRPPG